MKKGFTLVEMIVIIAIISILALLSAPEIMSTVESSNAQVCKDHQKAIMSEYYAKAPYTSGDILGELLVENANEICPNNGLISRIDNKLSCSKHGSYLDN